MKLRPVALFILTFTLVLLTLFTNCDNVSLNPRQDAFSSKLDGEICTLPPEVITKTTKFIFLVDESGSNIANDTDRDKSFRLNTIKAFVDKHANNPKVFWSFIVFGTIGGADRAYAHVNTGNPAVAQFTNSPATIYGALTRFNTQDVDNGNTPYHKAIDMAVTQIQADKAANSTGEAASYIVVLMSDGVPTDAEYFDSMNQLDQARINADARRFSNEGARLSTIYYGLSNIEPARRLEEMANTGGGQFNNVNVDGRLPLESVITLPYLEPWVVKRFVVANLNAAPCDDGSMDADSDADGICDKDEEKYNQLWINDPTYSAFKARMGNKRFDPVNRNSFSSSYNDLTYYKYITQGEYIDAACTSTQDTDHDLLNLCEEVFLRTSSVSGPTPDWTSKMGTDSDPLNFDSDGDGFTDWLELVFERTSSAGMNFNSTSRLIDGYRMDEIISQYRNPRRPAQTQQPYDGSLRFSRINPKGQSCYTYTQSVLPLYPTKHVTVAQVSGIEDLAHEEGESVIEIYFVQTPQNDPNGTGEIRHIFQRLKIGQPQLNLNLKVDQYLSYLTSGARARSN